MMLRFIATRGESTLHSGLVPFAAAYKWMARLKDYGWEVTPVQHTKYEHTTQ